MRVKNHMPGTGSSWFVCQTKVREEARARYFLAEKGYEVYLPMMESQRMVGSRVILGQKPLFPNYLFARFRNEASDLYAVRWTKGVVKILPESVSPASVDDQVVESIRALSQEDGVVRKKDLKKNDRVKILQGPFKEVMGIFEEWTSDSGRVRILLQFVNYQARVELPYGLVERQA